MFLVCPSVWHVSSVAFVFSYRRITVLFLICWIAQHDYFCLHFLKSPSSPPPPVLSCIVLCLTHQCFNICSPWFFFLRNKELILAAQVIPLLEEMISNHNSHPSATALYLNLSCLEDAKPIIGTSQAVPFLTQLLKDETAPQCKLDALHALYNLSTNHDNIGYLLSAGIISGLQSLLADSSDQMWTEKSIAVLINLASSQSGKDEMVSCPELISILATVLDTGEPVEQEQAVLCLLVLCNGNDKCIQMVLQEGVIPALVSISVNGTLRGREKAQKLLMLFREQRQRDQSPANLSQRHHHQPEETGHRTVSSAPEAKPLCKSISRRKTGKGWGFLWKSKSYSVYQC